MKKAIPALLAAFVLAAAFGAIAAEPAKMALKAGDEVFVCNCGADCPCSSVATKESNCSCGKAMTRGKVTKVEDGTAVVRIGTKEQTFGTAGKFACACGQGCDCGAISQSAGKCACGRPMREVKAN